MMRKILATLCLAALAGNASAEWKVLVRGESATSYIDKSTIRRSGKTVKMWTLTDYAEARTFSDGVSYLSTVMLMEFDCAERRSRNLQAEAYDGQMREGKAVFFTSKPDDWAYTMPDTTGDIRLKVACKTK